MQWRAATDSDLDLLASAVDAEAWFDEVRDLRQYLLDGWGRAGDLGVLGTVEDRLAAASWVRTFGTAPTHLGFVDVDVPVLMNAWVSPERRQLGHGTAMLAQVFDMCSEAGHNALSLATDQTNPAVRLYLRLGFQINAAVGTRWQMLKQLD